MAPRARASPEWVAWTPLLAMATVGLVSAYLVASVGLVDGKPAALTSLPTAADGERVQELVRARVLWFLSITALAAAELLALLRLGRLIWDRWRAAPGIAELLLVASAIAAAGLWVFLGVNELVIQELTDPIRGSLAEADVAASRHVTVGTDSLTAAVAVAVAFAFSAVLRRSRPGGNEIRELAERMAESITVLRTGAALLVLGVLEVAALFHWSVARFDPGGAQGALVHDLATTVSLGVGGFFSLLLAAGYVPTRTILAERARELERERNTSQPPTPSAKWLAAHGLASSGHLATMDSVLTVLGPLLAGSLGPLAEGLRGLVGSG